MIQVFLLRLEWHDCFVGFLLWCLASWNGLKTSQKGSDNSSRRKRRISEAANQISISRPKLHCTFMSFIRLFAHIKEKEVSLCVSRIFIDHPKWETNPFDFRSFLLFSINQANREQGNSLRDTVNDQSLVRLRNLLVCEFKANYY